MKTGLGLADRLMTLLRQTSFLTYYRTLLGVRDAMPIRSFMQPGAFEPEVIGVMSEALEAALKKLQDTGQTMVPEVIASRIIAAAKLGERDPVRLREAALRKRD
jgi:hypothetical protein